MSREQQQASFINLTVKSQQDQSKLFFRIRRDSELKRLLNAYCDKKFLPHGSCHFLINGDRFAHHKTPDELGLENGDEIDAFVPTDGGGGGSRI
ncbi:Small ubiquitin-related modifier [Melia azedarach]|uniref:Small ubiquitin-related modifier n=1 Tax=Melia azedarach TaxID=155640 RepID=A0ACC1YJ15_MELAZ|nr:Small ubiquitin-related modifier [Melia azedarach]